MTRRTSFSISLLLIVPIAMYSQSRRGGIPGAISNAPSRIEIQLTTDHSRPLQNMQVYVEVTSPEGGNQSGYTDMSGRVGFSVRSGSEYQVTASGPAIQPASASFEVPSGERFYRQDVEVTLRSGAENTPPPGGTVPASFLRAPEKARQEFIKGMKEIKERNWSKAREHFQKAIDHYPQFGWAYNNLGMVYLQENNPQAARDAFEKAIAIDDKNADAVRNLARMKLMDHDFNGAHDLLLKIGPDPRDLDALAMLAYAQLNRNELKAALANALKVHQEPDRFPFAHLVAARVYELTHNQAAAQAQYEKYLKEAPDGSQAQIAKQALQRLAARR